MNEMSTCRANLCDIRRRKPSRGARFKIAYGPENENWPLVAAHV